MIKLEEICGYLPYGLKVLYEKGGSIKNIIGAYSFNDGHSKTINWILDTLENRDNNYWNFKPILRNISDLTREIEHNGEKFVPIVELAKIDIKYDESEGDFNYSCNNVEHNKTSRTICVTSKWNHISEPNNPFESEITIFRQNVINNQYWIIQKLFEWHFWLGDKSRFGQDIIDINTLNK